jgi:hypothetical protein
MRFKLVLSLVLVAVTATAATAQRPRVRIDRPEHGDLVEAREEVAGVVADKSAEVWVIVRPRATRGYWVQAPVEVNRQTGTWRGIGCFGEYGEHHGARYDVAAVVNPTFQLQEGMVLRGWPRAEARSATIVVTRR